MNQDPFVAGQRERSLALFRLGQSAHTTTQDTNVLNRIDQSFASAPFTDCYYDASPENTFANPQYLCHWT